MYMLHVHLSIGSTNIANMLIPGLFLDMFGMPIAPYLEMIRLDHHFEWNKSCELALYPFHC